jgi:GxxExxY protein
MPMEISKPLTVLTQDEYHEVDRLMFGHVIAIHNDFGRLLDEGVYRDELAQRCNAAGLAAETEVLVRVRHESFSKDYFIDLVLAGSTVVEAKTVKELSELNKAQALNYLMMTGTRHGSLVNFRGERAMRHFSSTRYTTAERLEFTVQDAERSSEANPACRKLLQVAMAFCRDVGLGLDVGLYRSAYAFLAGKPIPATVPLFSNGKLIGHQTMRMLTDDFALAVTAFDTTDHYASHLQRLINMTALEGLAWINQPVGRIEFRVLLRQNNPPSYS